MSHIILSNPMMLLSLSLIGYLLWAVLGAISGSCPRFGALLSVGTLVSGAATMLSAVQTMFVPVQVAHLPFLNLSVELSGLNSLLLLIMGLCGFLAGLYNMGAISRMGIPKVLPKGPLLSVTPALSWCVTLNAGTRSRFVGLINLMLAALTAAVVSGNAFGLVLSLELASLCGYFLTIHGTCKNSLRAAQNQFLLMRSGTLLLIVAFGLLYSQVHSLDFATIRTAHLPVALRNEVFLIALAGFGIFAGIMPLHAWVPQSHSSASPSVAMIFSSGLMKVGLLGILKISLDLLGAPDLWWGLLVLFIGITTGFFGGLYALMEHDIRRLLAFHTLENIGIILLGIGGAMVGTAMHLPVLTAFALIGALFHLFNHSLFKSTLFLAAGAIQQQTGLKDIEKMGGLSKKMPLTCLSMFIALVAMAALPPLNGFASEWLIYQGLFHFSAAPIFVGHLFGPLLAVVLAMTGALAVMCVSKVFGAVCLGAPRSEEVVRARHANPLQAISAFIPAVFCIVAGLGAAVLVPMFARLSGIAPQHAMLDAGSLVSNPMIAILIIGCTLLPVLLAAAFQSKRLPRRVDGNAWACGYEHEKEMVTSATSFAQPLRVFFGPFYKLRRVLFPTKLSGFLHRNALVGVCRGLAALELAVLIIVALAH